ncbi:MAG: hypothetical protein JWN73_3842 [Betaproteobacteria bacterium]|nr:hypothetical protein [Betaproteobacteria bacterium]
MQNSYESFIENCLYAGAAAEASRSLDEVTRPADAAIQPVQGLLDRLQQAQSAFSDSLERYIEL